MSDEEALADVLALLKRMFPETFVPPTAFKVTRWSRDEFSYGSYSYVPPTGSKTDYDRLAVRRAPSLPPSPHRGAIIYIFTSLRARQSLACACCFQRAADVRNSLCRCAVPADGQRRGGRGERQDRAAVRLAHDAELPPVLRRGGDAPPGRVHGARRVPQRGEGGAEDLAVVAGAQRGGAAAARRRGGGRVSGGLGGGGAEEGGGGGGWRSTGRGRATRRAGAAAQACGSRRSRPEAGGSCRRSCAEAGHGPSGRSAREGARCCCHFGGGCEARSGCSCKAAAGAGGCGAEAAAASSRPEGGPCGGGGGEASSGRSRCAGDRGAEAGGFRPSGCAKAARGRRRRSATADCRRWSEAACSGSRGWRSRRGHRRRWRRGSRCSQAGSRSRRWRCQAGGCRSGWQPAAHHQAGTATVEASCERTSSVITATGSRRRVALW